MDKTEEIKFPGGKNGYSSISLRLWVAEFVIIGRFRGESAGALSRGDRRISSVIERVYRKRGVMDNWREFFSLRRWQEGFEEEGLDLDFYTHREREIEKNFPVGTSSPE